MSGVRNVAQRVTIHEAKRHFAAGGAVLVHARGWEDEVPVGPDTTTHTRDTITWEELVGMVRLWRGRYPQQRYYIVED